MIEETVILTNSGAAASLTEVKRVPYDENASLVICRWSFVIGRWRPAIRTEEIS
jgi:hypothetical protein